MDSMQADVGRALSALGGGTVSYRTFSTREDGTEPASGRDDAATGHEMQSAFPLLAAALPQSAAMFRDPAGPAPTPPGAIPSADEHEVPVPIPLNVGPSFPPSSSATAEDPGFPPCLNRRIVDGRPSPAMTGNSPDNP